MDNLRNQKDGTVTGVFNDKQDAERAYSDLLERGYSSSEITVLMSDETRDLHFKGEDSDLGSKAMEKAGVGSAIGGTAGAIIGAIAAIGTSVAIPGLGLVIAGPLAAGLAGAGAGGLTGGLIGALVGSGIPKEKAEVYENRIKEGGIVLGVTPKTSDERLEIANNWSSNYRGEEIHGVQLSEDTFGTTGTAGTTGAGGVGSSSMISDENRAESMPMGSGSDFTRDRDLGGDPDMTSAERTGSEQFSKGTYRSSDLTHSTDELNTEGAGSFREENRLNIKGNWNEIKGRLKQQYASLTDDDLTYYEGREDEMLGKLQQKTGKSKIELAREINGYNY